MHYSDLPDDHRGAPWRPAVDIYRCTDGWLAKFDLAGVRPRDIEVSLRGRTLIIGGVRRDLLTESGHRYYSMEISYSRFRRVVELPVDLQTARISTEYRDGMLLVRLQTGEGS
ncbi:MAG: Hsp20/alpha crystallin family protein [Candidatus Competibacteraceae bacterium]|nr:Hsp20/alpha crystallin family protein [Candidatus Competibacteraceae bacterium]